MGRKFFAREEQAYAVSLTAERGVATIGRAKEKFRNWAAAAFPSHDVSNQYQMGRRVNSTVWIKTWVRVRTDGSKNSRSSND